MGRLLKILLVLFIVLPIYCGADEELSIRQKILMPGPLTQSHAEYETSCENCHASFSKQSLTKNCVACHEKIGEDREQKTGFHGQSPFASVANCETCHHDHEGRDADITGLLPDVFNHDFTRFPLEESHKNLACNDCHQAKKAFSDASTECSGCHKKQDVHQGKLGDKCDSCHQPKVWRQTLAFDHSETSFPLEGLHQQLSCNSCHFGERYSFTNTSCSSCHGSADIHGGANGRECESCHSVTGWKNLKFDHDETEFPLIGSHKTLPCQACHTPGSDRKLTPKTCNGCHATDDVHLGRHGDKCESCHNNNQWQDITFKHDIDTSFALTGKHSALACTQCHGGSVHTPLGRDCGSCHQADDVHHDPNMALCGTCHNTDNWRTISTFDHDFSQFPLVGMHQIVPCGSCHLGNQFSGTSSECGSCHKNVDIHKGTMGDRCNQCHTPNAWNIWQFDHDTDTQFSLQGKHSELACEACHLPGQTADQAPTLCGACHKRQDVHDGEFGDHCDRCHTTNNFFELMFR